jgi:hypothetical protein
MLLQNGKVHSSLLDRGSKIDLTAEFLNRNTTMKVESREHSGPLRKGG